MIINFRLEEHDWAYNKRKPFYVNTQRKRDWIKVSNPIGWFKKTSHKQKQTKLNEQINTHFMGFKN